MSSFDIPWTLIGITFALALAMTFLDYFGIAKNKIREKSLKKFLRNFGDSSLITIGVYGLLYLAGLLILKIYNYSIDIPQDDTALFLVIFIGGWHTCAISLPKLLKHFGYKKKKK